MPAWTSQYLEILRFHRFDGKPKRVQRLMRLMGLRDHTGSLAMYAGSIPTLRDLTITRANQVWAADITYLPMARGFLYLVAIMDWRYVVVDDRLL